jgi:CheY-like chemotaxis protein
VAPPAGAGRPTAPAETLPLEVLVAEDNEVNRTVLLRMLGRLGCRVTAVENGRQAVEAARRARFDVVLMDLQMPVMDGFEATRAIREHEATAGGRVRILAISAHAMAGDDARCLAAGMDDYVPKPVRFEDLARKLAEDAGAAALDAARDRLEEARGVVARPSGAGTSSRRPPA